MNKMREKYSIGDYYKHGLAMIFLKTQSQREKFEKLELMIILLNIKTELKHRCKVYIFPH